MEAYQHMLMDLLSRGIMTQNFQKVLTMIPHSTILNDKGFNDLTGSTNKTKQL